MLCVKQWRESFEDALAKIEGYRNDENESVRLLTRWLMETEANPYGYQMRGYAMLLQSAEGFAGLLQTIHHALVDDGELTFVVVSGRPMMVFAARDEIGFVELRSEVEILANERDGTEPTYEFLNGVQAFIDRQDRYEAHKAARIELAGRRNARAITMEEWRVRAVELEDAYERSIHPDR
ncbi:hypothetical protein G6L37_34665 [Agrobacterium rubi]|nr:hypothetical protein [Agrobacterium rubi]NTF23711.1 hypothetical protein [Agrobacterium rubi]